MTPFHLAADDKNPKATYGMTSFHKRTSYNYHATSGGKKPFDCNICDYSCIRTMKILEIYHFIITIFIVSYKRPIYIYS